MQPNHISSNRDASDIVLDDVLADSIPPAVEAEIDDLIARADTYTGEAGGEDHQLAEELFIKTAPKYMQGVVRGQQAYLTTNLLETGSLMLLQPQMVWTIGRHRDAGIPVRDRMLSRRHASIVYLREEHAFFLLDLNSLNGSYVNGLRVEQQKLKDGDFLRIGNTEFYFYVSEQYENLEPLHAEVHAKLLSTLLREKV